MDKTPTVRVVLIVCGALFLGALGGAIAAALWTVVFVRTAAPIAGAMITGFIACSVGLVGVFQEQLRIALNGPVLRLYFDPHTTGDVHITFSTIETSGQSVTPVLRIPTAFVRFRVGNYGGMAAKQVEVLARRLERQKADATYEAVPEFTPINLRWSYTGETYIQQIPRRVEKHCDVFFVLDPAVHVPSGIHMTPSPPAKGVMTFTHTPNVHPGLLDEGVVYRLTVLVGAENVAAQDFTITIRLPSGGFGGGVKRASEVIEIRGLPLAP